MEKRIEELTIYFSRYKSNNMYYVAIKHHVAMHLMKKGVGPSEIGKIIKTDRSTVLYHRDTYRTHDWHDEFIAKNFDRYIKEYIYPDSSSNGKLIEKHIERSDDEIEIEIIPNKKEVKTAFRMPQKYVDICEVFGMSNKVRDELMLCNRNYLILYLKVEYDIKDKYLQSLFGISHSSIVNALSMVRGKIDKVDPVFYKYTEVLRYILHNGDTRTGKIFLWSQGKGKPPGSNES